jgi:hypothetical protein
LEFIERFAPRERGRRVGQRFPLLPDLEPALIESKIAESTEWMCEMTIPSWVYKLFRVERPGTDSVHNAVEGNVRLFQFMYQMRDRKKRLARIVTRAAILEDKGPVLYGGCYIGGTGREAREQAFVPGVFQRLIVDQSSVSWTENALADDANYHRLTRLGYVGLTFLVLLLGALIYLSVKTLR